MPITKSAKKALRQSKRRRAGNLAKKTAYKVAVKKVRALVLAGDKKEIQSALSLAYKTLDKAAKTNVIAKNKAARLKSRLAKLIRLRASKA
ncbi:MAG: 30S ribosomal protein S20 [Parcubacteria group bacterium GW2011_GWB1_52_7]|nr:MAG: 30S ribosomal protein S20 [Parcubacteria group bacterium GW2011_GWA1_51_12]KKW28972.1 MAG: 30S ribosomal protein S20 [Parcubacteria group bacterium GW2011_GWB1_52_7]KKW31755.1 MAG: 30S ribosomal protein S20 [Parcubacteria group bacterium GW2011_GWC2_52_8c]